MKVVCNSFGCAAAGFAAAICLSAVVCVSPAAAQSPGTLYTWPNTGNIADWAATGSANLTTLSNTTAGQLTATETGDELDPSIVGGPFVLRDGFNRRLESSTAAGGLDVTGLGSIQIDLAHNSTGTVNVQFFLQATPAFNYLWAGSDGALGGPDWAVGPGLQTLTFPLALLSPAQQAYIRTIGLSVRNHAALGNLTWNIFDVRKVGPSATSRILATHDAGSPENGLNGAVANFDQAAIVGNDGGQNQSGLSQVTNGSVGSLKWTDKGGAGTTASPSGAAISWGNGQPWDGNTFNNRLSDFSNYGTVTFRVSATDALNAGGSLGIQAWFQTGEYSTPEALFQTTGVGTNGEIALPIDGQYHDLVFPLSAVVNRLNVQQFGINLFAHTNDLVINVDSIRFDEVTGVPGDYNGNGVVDGADYVLWRNGGPLQNEVDAPGTVNAADYAAWRARFGNTSGSGSLGETPVPEPTSLVVICITVACGFLTRKRSSAARSE